MAVSLIGPAVRADRIRCANNSPASVDATDSEMEHACLNCPQKSLFAEDLIPSGQHRVDVCSTRVVGSIPLDPSATFDCASNGRISPALRLRRNAWADLRGIFCTVVGGIVILQHRRAHERLQVGTGALAHAPSESLEAMAFKHTVLHDTLLNRYKIGGVH